MAKNSYTVGGLKNKTTYRYGDPVYDPSGQQIGTAKYNPKTGKTLKSAKSAVEIDETTSPLAVARSRYTQSLEPDRDTIRQADEYAASVRQSRIDAINQMFAPRIQREQQEGQSRLSRVAALNFNKGIVGSGVDTTFTGEQKQINEQAIQAIESEKAAMVNEAFGIADKIGKERREELTAQKQAGAKANLEKYEKQYEEAIKALQMFGKAGYSLQEISDADPNTISTLKEIAGLPDSKIDALLKTSAPEGTYQWGQAKYVGNQVIVPKTVNGTISLETIQAPEGINFDKKEEPAKSAWKFSPSVGKAGAWYNEQTKEVDFVAEPPKLKESQEHVSWDDYLNQARQMINGPLTKDTYDQLKSQYDADFPSSEPGFTAQEKKKLEQAGLLYADRQKQLDYLYGSKNEEIINPFL